ncbi:putative transposase [Mycolicibacterium rutilum]|uniref:Putative transposase n=1 Tax=Mycolicibacterium rutilum TaxID=370526 RepID=A0A1H6JFS7_MYCRU|nr:IS607 family element RNA-guided endonuclease TnpB [Mycolicibacterium rutilum]SEH57940.1 putative transposase [Mycolicibacterium rutilum]
MSDHAAAARSTMAGGLGTRSRIRSYRYALAPSRLQEDQLRSHCGAQRFAYNWGLAQVKANLEQRSAESTYGICGKDLTPALNWSAYAMRRIWNRVKSDIAPWWQENSKEAYSSGLANLATALRNWAASATKRRQGRPVGFPRFKSKKSRLSCWFTTGALGLVASDRRHVKLPRIGIVRTHESTRKLARRLESGSARIRSATVAYDGGRWFVSFSVELQGTSVSAARSKDTVGVDVGILHLAVLSTPVRGLSDASGLIANPAHHEGAIKKLRRLQRKTARRVGPDRRAGTIPSARWRRARDDVRRQHAKIANQRADTLHWLTSALAERFGTVVIEDLNVAGMLRNRRLARRISAAAWAEMRRQLEYKTDWRGGRVLVADRFYPSSKTCSGCGVVKAKLRLSERVFTCDTCGLTIDRDRNAVRNLAALAADAGTSPEMSSPSCGATENEPAGNPNRDSLRGQGYCHGKPPEGNAA